MKWKLPLGALLLMLAASTHAQINPIVAVNAVINVAKFGDKVAKIATLFVCHVTNLREESVKNALHNLIFNVPNPNITMCVAGCAVTGLYSAQEVVGKVTGVQLLGFVPRLVGEEAFNSSQACYVTSRDDKCAFLITYVTCALSKLAAILERDVTRLGALLAGFFRDAFRNMSTALGTIVPGAKPLLDRIQEVVELLLKLSPLGTQPALGQVPNTTTTVKLSTVLAPQQLVSTTAAPRVGPIQNIFNNFWKSFG